MNVLTKNRIIEKGDEFHAKDGRWMPVPDKNVGLQIMFSEYKEVRRPSEKPISIISPDSDGKSIGTKAEKEKTPVPIPSGAGGTLHDTSYLPTVVSKKAHTELVHDPALDAMEAEQAGLAKVVISFVPPAAIEYSDLSAMPGWIGRNGTFKATGLNVQRMPNDLIQLRPIGKRGLAKNALIEIPVADIPTLIARLNHLAR